MRFQHLFMFATILIVPSSICCAQGSPKLENATAAVLNAFEAHDIVMFDEIHGNKQEYEWLRSLVATPQFADRVDDIVVETGNSLYQKSVDRYVSGEEVPLEQVQKAELASRTFCTSRRELSSLPRTLSRARGRPAASSRS